jgi:hypothetical protein
VATPRQRLESVSHGLRVSRSGPTGISEGPAAAATEVDAKSFEHGGGSEIGGDDLADCSGG